MNPVDHILSGPIFKGKNAWKWQAAIIATLLVFLLVSYFAEPLREMYEIASINTFPNAQRAFDFGERHFSSSAGDAYNVDLADYFFAKAQAMDPSLEYVDHERARVAFIRGQFDTALKLIDRQIAAHGTSTPNSYYVRGLIEGYMGRYDAAAKDYSHYLGHDLRNWAGLNDYAWILIKAKRFNEAAGVAAYGLQSWPENPWLLNSYAIASSELGHNSIALEAITMANTEVLSVNTDQWLRAYPGNDPRIATEGIDTLARSIEQNFRAISDAAQKNNK